MSCIPIYDPAVVLKRQCVGLAEVVKASGGKIRDGEQPVAAEGRVQ